MDANKILIVIFSLIFLYSCNSSSLESNGVDLKIGTASIDGNYYPLGKSIETLVDSINTSFNIEVIETKGSVDNIERLSRGEIDLAIVQNDIAFFAENGLDPFDSEVSNLAGIASFYSEPIYLLTNDHSINYLSQLENKEINIGPIGSGLYTDAKIILNSFNLWSFLTPQTESPEVGGESLLEGGIDAAFMNTIPDNLKKAISEGELKLIPIRESTISRLSTTYPYFVNFESDEFGRNIKTFAVRAILISRSDLNSNVVNELTKIINENINQLKFPTYYSSITSEQLVSSMSLQKFHEGAITYYQEVDLLESQKLLKIFGSIFLAATCLIILVFLINIYWLPKPQKNKIFLNTNTKLVKLIKRSHKFVTDHKFIVVLIFMVSAYFIIIFLVQQVEHSWAIQNNSMSSFNNRTFGENLLWIFIFGGSGYEDNIFPQSPVAKFLVTLIPLLGLGGFLALAGLLLSDHVKNKILNARGMKPKMMKDHIILCGWNDNVPFLINNLLHDNLNNKKQIVLLTDHKDDMPLESNNIDKDYVTYVRGKATKKSDLKKANMQEADVAIIVSDKESSDADATSILKILTIEKYCKELEKDKKRVGRKNIYTIAEIQDTENFESAYDAEVDEIISLGHIKSKILVHSILNPGVSNFINEILTYNEFNEIYSIQIDRKSDLFGRTFDDLLIELRRKNILLLSISIGNHSGRKELNDIKQKFQLKRTVLTNPISEKEICYKTQSEDTLIVLAEDEDVVQSAIKTWET